MSNLPLPVLNPPVLDRSRPVVRRPVELATHLGLKIYNRTFPRIEAAMFLAEVITHLQGHASRDYAAEIDQVSAAINGELARLEAFATGETRQLEKALRQAGAAGEVSYTRPVRVELTMRTPGMRRYAELVARVEETARTLDQSWYAGAVSTPVRLERENRLFRHFHRSCGVVERLARGLARRVRDDSEAPGYRDLLVKRTGRGPDAAVPAVTDEGREEMTVAEARSLQATEALAGAWLAAGAAGDAPEAGEAGEAEAAGAAGDAPEAGEAGEAEAVGADGDPEVPQTALLPEGEPSDAGTPAEGVQPRRRTVRDWVLGGAAA